MYQKLLSWFYQQYYLMGELLLNRALLLNRVLLWRERMLVVEDELSERLEVVIPLGKYEKLNKSALIHTFIQLYTRLIQISSTRTQSI